MKKKLLFWLIVIVNLIGAAFGFIFFYGRSLLRADPLLAIFIADCPLYTLLIAIVFILAYFRKRISWLYFLAFVGALKYGFWTIFVLATYQNFYYSPGVAALMYYTLFIAHIGLILETTLLFGKIELKKFFIGIALFWFLLNDFVDYVFMTHPPLPSPALGFMFPATAAMSIGFTLIAYYLIKKIKKSPIELF